MRVFFGKYMSAISLFVIFNLSTQLNESTLINFEICNNDVIGMQLSTPSSLDMGLYNFNCNNPVDNFSASGVLNNQSFNNGGVYGDFYFLVTLTGNQRAVITISGANAVMQEIGPCNTPDGGDTAPLAFCTAGVYKIRVQNTNQTVAATFTANITITTLAVASITRTESSGSVNNDGILCEGGQVSLQAVMTDPSLTGLTYSWAGPNGYSDSGNPVNINPVTVSNTGTYTVTVTDANMCTTTFTTTLTVNPVPEFTISDAETSGIANDDETVCVGDPFTLTANFTVGAGATYSWAFPGGTGSTNPLVIASASIVSHNGTFNLTVTDANGCTNTANIVMSVEPLPAVSNTTLKACAISTGSNQGDFVLEDANEADNYPTNQNDGTDVDNGAGGVTVTYHTTLAAANAGTGAIASGVYTNGTVVFARVENDATGSHAVAQVTLEVVPLPAKSNTELRACADPGNPGTADFTLSDAELAPAFPAGNSNVTADIDNGNGGLDISYHPTLADAQGNTGEIFDGPYANGTTVFARIYNTTTTCFDVATVLLTVLPLPTANDTELRECEMPAGSNQAMFTLTDAQLPPGFPATNSNVTADVDNSTTFTVTFHGTQAGAENNTGQIGATGTFTDGAIVYARVEDPATGCAGVAEILLTVLEAPTPEIQYEGSPANFTICAGEAFDLTVVSTTGTAPFTYNWTLPTGTGAGSPYSVGSAVVAIHNGNWVVTVTDANGCTGTDNINITVTPAPANGSCGSAINVGTGFSPLSFSGTTVCAPDGGPCAAPDNESAVYFTYTVPPEGLTRLRVNVPGFNVSIGPGCGSGNCEPDASTIECPDPGSTIYITVSSSEAGEGAFNGQVLPAFEPPAVTGTVFVDLDMDGSFSGADVPLGGVSIAAFPDCNKSNTPILVTTDDSGNFTFAPGSLPVPPLTYLITIDPNSTVGCDANVAECIELDPCENNLDAILFPCPPTNCTSVGKQDILICQNEIPYTYRDTTFNTEVTDFPYVLDIKAKNGCDSIVKITIRIYKKPKGVIFLSLGDFCVSGKQTLSLAYNPGHPQLESIKWSTNATNVSKIEIANSGIYNVTIVDGCNETAVESIDIGPFPQKITEATITGTPIVNCIQGTINGSLKATGNGVGFGDSKYIWSTGTTTQTLSLTNSAIMTYTVTITDFCGTTAIATYTAINLPDDVLLKNDTVYVKPNVPVTLNVTDNDKLPSEPYTIKAKEISSETVNLLSFDNGGNVTLQVNGELNEDERITYEVCDDCNLCYEGILVIINEDFKNFIPVTLFTPDASSNKTLQFTKLPVKDSKLWIYNRWGQQIYFKEGYENDWNADGYPGGVYYYVLEIYGVKIKKTLTVVK